MNEIEKIGMYSTDEILEFMTEGEGRGFLGRSMFDAMYFKIKNLQSKIDKISEYTDKIYDVMDYKDYPPYLDEIYYTLHPELKEDKQCQN